MKIGQVCIKLAGRDAKKYCAIIDIIDETYVLIEGETRRKKCNIKHLHLIEKNLDIKKNATKEEVINGLTKLDINIKPKKIVKQKNERKKRTVS